MNTPFENDPLCYVWLAFRRLYPDKSCRVYWDAGLKTDDGSRCYGFTTFCNDGEIKCAGQPGIEGDIGYYECYDGKWSEEFVNCSEGLICSKEEQKCIDNPEPACTPDDVKCVDDKTYQVCDPVTGLWTTSTGICEDGFVCRAIQKVPSALDEWTLQETGSNILDCDIQILFSLCGYHPCPVCREVTSEENI